MAVGAAVRSGQAVDIRWWGRQEAFASLSGEPAWKTIPSWYLVATLDKAIPPATQRFMAQRAGKARRNHPPDPRSRQRHQVTPAAARPTRSNALETSRPTSSAHSHASCEG